MAMDHYQRLGVGRDASDAEIHRAYRRLARRYHPDMNEGGEADARFGALSVAYEVLHDPEQRASYDRSFADAARDVRPRVPYFVARRRDVPRFIEEEFEPGSGWRRIVRVQINLRWGRL